MGKGWGRETCLFCPGERQTAAARGVRKQRSGSLIIPTKTAILVKKMNGKIRELRTVKFLIKYLRLNCVYLLVCQCVMFMAYDECIEYNQRGGPV